MIITLCGSNTFAARQALDALVAAYVAKHGEHGLERVDGESFDAQRLPDLTQGASLFAANRLIIVRDASKNKPLWEALGEVVQRVPSETTIVLVEGGLDKRTRTYKQLKAHSDFRECVEPGEAELVKWIMAEATASGGKIDRAAAQYLAHVAGADQWRLKHEIAKLCAYHPEITRASIDELVEPSTEASAFDLLDYALGKQAAKVGELLAKLQTNEDPYKLFGLLVSQVHTLALVAYAGGRTPDDIAKAAGVHPFVVRKMSTVAKKMSRHQVQTIIADVAETDHKLKSTGHEPWLLVEQVLHKIATT